jgi:hypothetical protein
VSANDKIVESVYAAMRGEIEVPRITSDYCLRAVRMVLEHALGWADEELYARFPNKIESNTLHPRPFWSRDIQRSLREAGWGVALTSRQPGDLLFYYRAAMNEQGDYVVHTGILLPGGFIFENINPKYRQGTGAFSSGALSLTPSSTWGMGEVEAFRVPERLA